MNSDRVGDIVFDIETKKSFEEVGGKEHLDKLGISVIGAYVYWQDRYIAYEEHEIPEFEKLLGLASRVIGFNIHHFDLPVLRPYISPVMYQQLSTLDLMEDIERGVGFRVSLGNLCEMTLGAAKSADGMQAIRWYRDGKIEEIKKYCLVDVQLTKDLYEFGKKNSHVLFFSKSAMGRIAVPVSWGGIHGDGIRDVLRNGLSSHRSIEIDYVTKAPRGPDATARNRRLVDVYTLLGDSFEGYCHLRKAKRVFKIDRILSARLTDNIYHMVEDVQGSLL